MSDEAAARLRPPVMYHLEESNMVREKVHEIIREVFLCRDQDIGDATTAADVEGWDSFNHMNLILRVEEEFQVAFATDEIGQIGSVGSLVAAVAAKTGLPA